MRWSPLLFTLTACRATPPPAEHAGDTAARPGADTGASDTAGDSMGDTGRSLDTARDTGVSVDTGASVDTAPDTGVPVDTAPIDTGADSAWYDTAIDTALDVTLPAPCDTAPLHALFEHTDGTFEDVTTDMGSRTHVATPTFTEDGTLWLCGGTWYAAVTLTGAVTIDGMGVTTLDGRGARTPVTSTGSSLALRDVTITDGLGVDGGGVSFQGDTLELDGVTIQTCEASRGGGVFAVADTVTVTDSVISENACDPYGSNMGGGLWLLATTAAFDGSTVDGNTAGDMWNYYTVLGAGIYFYGDALTLSASSVSSNVARCGYMGDGKGAGVYSTGTVALAESEVSGNQLFGQKGLTSGAGVYGVGVVTAERSVLNGNWCDDIYYFCGPAAIYGDTVEISASEVTGNANAYGGVLYARTSGTCYDSDVSGNTPADAGDSTSLADCASGGTVAF